MAKRPTKQSWHNAAAKVELFVLDVDGVLTDGSIYLDDLGHETKRFHVRDGFGIRLWQKLGFEVAIITGRSGRALKHRAAELGIRHVTQGASDKGAALRTLLKKLRLEPGQVACIGDDWPELPLMRVAGLSFAVADADERVIAAADVVTCRPGGHAAVREAIDTMIHAKGLMDRAAALYDEPHGR
jgi:3-deoxy-D-manno-octulosonate 8-phosphate phosphatase (KDO 8-P phosphatase)